MNRRDFLGRSGAAALLAATPGLACSRVLNCPAVFDDYRALVCVFLVGGNDSFNMLVPRSDPEYRAYKAPRRELAVPYKELLPVPVSGGRRFGIHSAMRSMQQEFGAGRAAFVANVGALVEPTAREDYLNKSVALPSRLFSHRGNQGVWSALPGNRLIDRCSSPSGWAERMANLMCGADDGQRAVSIVSLLGTNSPQPDRTRHRSFASSSIPSPTTVFPQSQLGSQLQTVAQLIAARDEIAARRQIYFVAAGGFDSHDNQADVQPGLLADVSESLAAFYRSTVELGVAENVTTFTESEFGRTLTSNGSGTDHAWGGNEFVLGGAVLGGRLYGRYPELRIGGPEDIGGGRFIPSTSADQYAATLAAWFGIPDADLEIVAPNLANFPVRNLGFLG